MEMQHQHETAKGREFRRADRASRRSTTKMKPVLSRKPLYLLHYLQPLFVLRPVAGIVLHPATGKVEEGGVVLNRNIPVAVPTEAGVPAAAAGALPSSTSSFAEKSRSVASTPSTETAHHTQALLASTASSSRDGAPASVLLLKEPILLRLKNKAVRPDDLLDENDASGSSATRTDEAGDNGGVPRLVDEVEDAELTNSSEDLPEVEDVADAGTDPAELTYTGKDEALLMEEEDDAEDEAFVPSAAERFLEAYAERGGPGPQAQLISSAFLTRGREPPTTSVDAENQNHELPFGKSSTKTRNSRPRRAGEKDEDINDNFEQRSSDGPMIRETETSIASKSEQESRPLESGSGTKTSLLEQRHVTASSSSKARSGGAGASSSTSSVITLSGGGGGKAKARRRGRSFSHEEQSARSSAVALPPAVDVEVDRDVEGAEEFVFMQRRQPAVVEEVEAGGEKGQGERLPERERERTAQEDDQADTSPSSNSAFAELNLVRQANEKTKSTKTENAEAQHQVRPHDQEFPWHLYDSDPTFRSMYDHDAAFRHRYHSVEGFRDRYIHDREFRERYDHSPAFRHDFDAGTSDRGHEGRDHDRKFPRLPSHLADGSSGNLICGSPETRRVDGGRLPWGFRTHAAAPHDKPQPPSNADLDTYDGNDRLFLFEADYFGSVWFFSFLGNICRCKAKASTHYEWIVIKQGWGFLENSVPCPTKLDELKGGLETLKKCADFRIAGGREGIKEVLTPGDFEWRGIEAPSSSSLLEVDEKQQQGQKVEVGKKVNLDKVLAKRKQRRRRQTQSLQEKQSEESRDPLPASAEEPVTLYDYVNKAACYFALEELHHPFRYGENDDWRVLGIPATQEKTYFQITPELNQGGATPVSLSGATRVGPSGDHNARDHDREDHDRDHATYRYPEEYLYEKEQSHPLFPKQGPFERKLFVVSFDGASRTFHDLQTGASALPDPAPRARSSADTGIGASEQPFEEGIGRYHCPRRLVAGSARRTDFFQREFGRTSSTSTREVLLNEDGDLLGPTSTPCSRDEDFAYTYEQDGDAAETFKQLQKSRRITTANKTCLLIWLGIIACAGVCCCCCVCCCVCCCQAPLEEEEISPEDHYLDDDGIVSYEQQEDTNAANELSRASAATSAHTDVANEQQLYDAPPPLEVKSREPSRVSSSQQRATITSTSPTPKSRSSVKNTDADDLSLPYSPFAHRVKSNEKTTARDTVSSSKAGSRYSGNDSDFTKKKDSSRSPRSSSMPRSSTPRGRRSTLRNSSPGPGSSSPRGRPT